MVWRQGPEQRIVILSIQFHTVELDSKFCKTVKSLFPELVMKETKNPVCAAPVAATFYKLHSFFMSKKNSSLQRSIIALSHNFRAVKIETRAKENIKHYRIRVLLFDCLHFHCLLIFRVMAYIKKKYKRTLVIQSSIGIWGIIFKSV